MNAMDSFFGKDVFAIGAGLLSIAMVALVLSHSKEAGNIIRSAGDTLNGLIGTVTLQNRFGNPWAI